MDTSGSGKVKLHIANVPYEMKWQELKDLLRDRSKVYYNLLCFANCCLHANSTELLLNL